MHNLLAEPLIRYAKNQGGVVWASLPEIYAALMHDHVVAFPALRPHQRHAWHAFLVQLAAIAMHRSNINNPPETPAEWETLIRNLTPDFPNDEPWRLVVDDIAKPAFMQPPASNWADYNQKDVLLTPDSLDMTDTAKGHDLKRAVGVGANAEDWVYALLAMQTLSGQVGRGNYPIARMNSGDGSRTAFSVTPALSPGAHLRHDVIALLSRSSEITRNLPFRWDGVGLLWTELWNGGKGEALLISDLHPFYIEVCRRRRLYFDTNHRLCGMRAASDYRRIEAGQNRGVVGDPWTLVDLRDKEGAKALTLQTDSFSYRRIVAYLTSGDWRLPMLYQPTLELVNGHSPHLLMRGVRRTKGGQTEGYHERAIPLRSKTRNAMLRPAGPDSAEDLGALAQKRLEEISIVQRILSHAIQTFASGGDSGAGRSELRALARPWLNKLDEAIDHRFFDDLQDEFEASNDDAERERIHNDWLQNFVLNQARSVLNNAMDSLPCRAIHRYRARVNAESLFEGRIRGTKGLPFLFNNHKESDE